MPLATVEDIARDALAALNSSAGHLLASRWVSERYKDLCSRARLRHLRRVAQVAIPGAVQVGTCGVNAGDNRVYGDAAAIAAWAQQDFKGWHFRARNVWYEVEGFALDHLILRGPFTETTVGLVEGFGGVNPPSLIQPNVSWTGAAFGTTPFGGNFANGGSYKLVRRYFEVPPTVRWLGTFVHMRRRYPLRVITYTELDSSAPDRTIVAGGPYVVAELNEDESGRRLLEFYPYSPTAETIHFTYWSVPPDLQPQDPIPRNVDPYVLKEGALVDVMRFEMAKAMQAGDVNGAALWRNEYRAQSTVWERLLKQAIATDRGSDDVTMILESRSAAPRLTDIRSAYDEVWARGARP